MFDFLLEGGDSPGLVDDSDHEVDDSFTPTFESGQRWATGDHYVTDDDDDDGGSLAEYLDQLRRRRLRQRQAYRKAVKEQEEEAIERQRELASAASYSSYVPVTYRGIKGFFVPQTNIAIAASAPADQTRGVHRRWKPHNSGSDRSSRRVGPSSWWWTDVSGGTPTDDDGDVDGRDRVAQNVDPAAVETAVGQWTDLVRREVRRALDEYDEVYRVAERLKAAAAAERNVDNDNTY
jgi:hypothetical protein